MIGRNISCIMLVALVMLGCGTTASRVTKVESVENRDWYNTCGLHTVEGYRTFLKKYPNSKYLEEAQSRINIFAQDPWEKARAKDKVPAYEAFLKLFPDSDVSQEARERLEWLRAHKAIVLIEYPEKIEATKSPYVNVSSPYWGWTTVLKEKGGSIDYAVEGKGYIFDARGDKWGVLSGPYSREIGRGKVQVKAGGSAKDHYWVSSHDHKFCNGRAIFLWKGEDANGNAITVSEEVFLSHKNCPGPGK